MSKELNYSELGFKSGIEIHQQLSGKKLFCNCSAAILDGEPEHKTKRRLRAVVGETGKIDTAAAYEATKGKYFVYHSYDKSNCLIDLDSAPPNTINQESLMTTLHVAKLLNAKIVDEVQIMRKTVIDGSNVSGFQRTALIARNGWIETSLGRVSIPLICLEEDAAKAVERSKTHDVYNISRLGIPLIEIATGPELKNPQHVKEAAEKIGMILRSVKGIKRGIGTIRQDVNVSIRGGSRVELKGFQEVRSIPKVVENEVLRHLDLIKKAGGKLPAFEAEVRKANTDGTSKFLRPMPGANRLYPETDCVPFRISEEMLSFELAETIEEKAKRYSKAGLGKDLALKLAKSAQNEVFENFLKKYTKIKTAFLAETLISAVKNVKKQFGVDVNPSIEDYDTLFFYLNEGRIAKDSLLEILKQKMPVKDIIKNYELMNDLELENEIKKIVAENSGLPFNALIGKAMGKLKGKAEGQKIMELLKKLSA